MLKDSGERREFETGAVRDIQEGKGRCDLLPLDVVNQILDTNKTELKTIELFKKTGDHVHLMVALNEFMSSRYSSIEGAMLELSKHFEEGAIKYGENNWKKGIPVHCYIDSAVRHYLKWLKCDEDEPHDRAFMWNLICAIWTCENFSQLKIIRGGRYGN